MGSQRPRRPVSGVVGGQLTQLQQTTAARWRALMPSSRWEPAIGTGGSGARKVSNDRVEGAIETLSRGRFGRLHF